MNPAKITTGWIRKPLVVLAALATFSGALLMFPVESAQAATFAVDRTGDTEDINLANSRCDSSSSMGDQCTLRAAIEEANDTAGADRIKFEIGDTSTVKTISPGSDLPTITEQVTIDGYTQQGASGNTLEEGNDAIIKVQLSGANAGANAIGLRIEAADSIVKGLAINRFDGSGILIGGAGATGNTVKGNFIGTNTSGTSDRGNGDGVRTFSSADDNAVGGTTPVQRNVISGNDDSGVEFLSSAGNNRVEGNFIGTTSDGTETLGNVVGVSIVSDGNTVGGTAVGAGNLISGNEFAGVKVTDSSALGNSILSNSIFDNGGLGIELGASGVTENDADDTDVGPNGLQNFPLISSATRSTVTGFTTIKGTLDSTPSQDFLIQCFLTEEGGDPSEHGEGAVLLDTTTRTTGAFGSVNFQCDSQIPDEEGQTVSATATNIDTGDTSEFSANETILEP